MTAAASSNPVIGNCDSRSPGSACAPGSRTIDFAVLIAVWVSLFAYGMVSAPIPAVNEPHYLCKAKNYWQPEWCANDFFLTSSNAHTVFFVTVGSLTQWLSLDQTAWIGRAAGTLVLAVGWCSLMSTLVQCRWSTLHICWVFLALQACGNFSGEWLVGGIEGKVFSYGLLFWALGQVQRGRLITAGFLTGLAISFHPVIGVWGVLSYSGVVVASWIWRRVRCNSAAATGDWATPRTSLGRALLAVVALVLCSLPGLIPVVRLLAEPASAQTKAAANYIQVYYRLAHHLDPMRFLPRAYWGYAALLLVWVIAMAFRSRSAAQRRFDGVVAFAVLFAIAGIIIGWGPRPAPQMPWYAQRAVLLKFYPFRLADVLVPLAVAIVIVLQSQAALWKSGLFGGPDRVEVQPRPHRFRFLQPIATVVIYGVFFVFALARSNAMQDSNRYANELRGDWIEACQWVDQHLPADALVHSPHNGWAFKWFAHRAEYVAFKDCPQDAAGIVEWNRRLNFLKKWFDEHYSDNFYSAEELRDLRRQTKITHILTDKLGPLELQPIYQNESFDVYDLTSLD